MRRKRQKRKGSGKNKGAVHEQRPFRVLEAGTFGGLPVQIDPAFADAIREERLEQARSDRKRRRHERIGAAVTFLTLGWVAAAVATRLAIDSAAALAVASVGLDGLTFIGVIMSLPFPKFGTSLARQFVLDLGPAHHVPIMGLGLITFLDYGRRIEGLAGLMLSLAFAALLFRSMTGLGQGQSRENPDEDAGVTVASEHAMRQPKPTPGNERRAPENDDRTGADYVDRVWLKRLTRVNAAVISCALVVVALQWWLRRRT